MRKNIHPIERVVRILGGLGIASLAFWGPQNMWFLLGLILVGAGSTGWCPIYTVLGVSTCKRPEPESENS